MADFPYINTQRAIDAFFDDHIQNAGVPVKVDRAYVESIGLKSKNDRPIIPILTVLGFLNSAGGPTERWQEYRSEERRRVVMAAAIRQAYPGLFQMYPDAFGRDDDAITNYMQRNTDVSANTVRLMVRTFKRLCERADFSASVPEVGNGPPSQPPETETQPPGGASVAGPSLSPAPTIAINIMLQIPPTDDPAVYERLFAAMKKHFG